MKTKISLGSFASSKNGLNISLGRNLNDLSKLHVGKMCTGKTYFNKCLNGLSWRTSSWTLLSVTTYLALQVFAFPALAKMDEGSSVDNFDRVWLKANLEASAPGINRTDLEALQLEMLFRLDGADEREVDGRRILVDATEKYQIQLPRVENSFAMQSCQAQEGDQEKYASFRFFRETKGASGLRIESIGTDQRNARSETTSAIKKEDGYTFGAWVKMRLEDNQLTKPAGDGPGMPVSGFNPLLLETRARLKFPNARMGILSRAVPAIPGAVSRPWEWDFSVTDNRASVRVNRKGNGEFAKNLPWAGNFGTCQAVSARGQSVSMECWVFVAMAFDPGSQRAMSFLIRDSQNSWLLHREVVPHAESSDTSFFNSSEVVLGAGAPDGAAFSGFLRGVFFAKHALSSEQLLKLALATAPSNTRYTVREGQVVDRLAYLVKPRCSQFDLKP